MSITKDDIANAFEQVKSVSAQESSELLKSIKAIVTNELAMDILSHTLSIIKECKYTTYVPIVFNVHKTLYGYKQLIIETITQQLSFEYNINLYSIPQTAKTDEYNIGNISQSDIKVFLWWNSDELIRLENGYPKYSLFVEKEKWERGKYITLRVDHLDSVVAYPSATEIRLL